MRTKTGIDRKYYVLIWIALLLACFMRNSYDIYLSAMELSESSTLTTLGMFIFAMRVIAFDGVVPMLWVFLCAFVVWQIGFARYVRCIPRNDFCYYSMLFTAAVYFVVGILEIFSILEPNIYVFTSTVLGFTLLTGAMIAMFFLVFMRNYRLNPVEKYNAFRTWFMIYMIVAGISTFLGNVGILIINDAASSPEIMEILKEMGYYISISKIQVGMSIATMCIYVAYLVAIIVIGERMRKEMQLFRNPDTRGDYYSTHENRPYNMRTDTGRVFDESGSMDEQVSSRKDDEHVFDEFDL